VKKRLALWLGINLTVILIIAFVLFLKMKQGINIYCMTHQLTGFFCPGCGVTRMLVSLVKGDLHTAFRYNPFLLITAFPAICTYLYGSYHWIKRSKVPAFVGVAVLIWGVSAVIFGILRNIPYFEGFLAPP